MHQLPAPGRRLRPLPLLAGLLLASSVALAQQDKALERVELPPLAKGEPVLEIALPAGAKTYDLATLEELGTWRLTTRSPWDEGEPTFEGVLLADLLADAGLDELAEVELIALDDYVQAIPREDWADYPVLVATRQDSEPLAHRGPLRVIYPLSAHPELDDDLHHARWVWSLSRIKPLDR
jgi:hypothetical protein